jgi:DNA-binding response OmpR family regulator
MSIENSISVLMIDDDRILTDAVSAYFISEGGFTFTSRNNGEAGLLAALSNHYDVIILDVMMPKVNGFETLKSIRSQKDTPVIMVTARGDDFDRILGLEIGADDYVPKPCSLRELVARVRAIMRRVSKKKEFDRVDNFLSIGDLKLGLQSLTVEKNDIPILITSTEFMVLEKLISMAGEIVLKNDISLHALGRRVAAFDRSVDAHIVNLRKKLGPMSDGQQRIKTVRRRGYIYVIM